uniref:Peptidase C15 pyroglutamyl peptidase I-like protein n=1 Tax=Bracon brevicornis TaxID=1563983 RepID=A0A6V7M2K8_9HYME
MVIHVGVSYKAKCLTLETKASSHGYKKKDITEKCPIEIDSNEITTLQCINVGLNIDKICKKLSEEHSILISDNAGRYLCEFTFYQSLSINPNRALFVHVPDFHVYPCQTTEKELFNLICCTLETLEDESAIMSTH